MVHTPKTFQSIQLYLKKVKNPPDRFCASLFFDSSIVLILGGLFLHRLYRILKFNLNWLRVPTTDFSRQKIRTRRENPNSGKLIWKARKKPPKVHTKNRPFFSAQFQRIGYKVHSTMIFPGSRVSNFAGNSCAKKLNKARTKRANITGAQNNLRGSTGVGVNFVLSFLFYFLFMKMFTFFPSLWRLPADIPLPRNKNPMMKKTISIPPSCLPYKSWHW